MKKYWYIILVSIIWITFFAALVANYALREFTLENKRLAEGLNNCQNFVGEVEKQISSGRIILEMKK